MHKITHEFKARVGDRVLFLSSGDESAWQEWGTVIEFQIVAETNKMKLFTFYRIRLDRTEDRKPLHKSFSNALYAYAVDELILEVQPMFQK